MKIESNLSDREFEMIRLIAAGLGRKQIAEKLILSIYMVNTHRSNIMKKTGKATIADLIIELKNLGLL